MQNLMTNPSRHGAMFLATHINSSFVIGATNLSFMRVDITLKVKNPKSPSLNALCPPPLQKIPPSSHRAPGRLDRRRLKILQSMMNYHHPPPLI